ncbi:hypothetical protein ABZV14_43980 [Streptosporangium canum]|uniref:hypothetical protein n=1 Tax=Streptosporangium canum TaxID=324952 RepID=UPI0033AB78F6
MADHDRRPGMPEHARARRTRREESAGALPPEPAGPHASTHPTSQADPEDEALLADSVGVALMVVLDTLTPAERLAFVLHDVFVVSFGEIGAIIDRSPAAVWSHRGQPKAVFAFTISDGKITRIAIDVDRTGSATSTSSFLTPTTRSGCEPYSPTGPWRDRHESQAVVLYSRRPRC